MSKDKIYQFNCNDICINPDTEVLYDKDKCYVEFTFARVLSGWVYGTEFWMTLNTVECYGVHGDGCYYYSEPMYTNDDCRKAAIKEAIEFFEEGGRKIRCAKVLQFLNNSLTKYDHEKAI